MLLETIDRSLFNAAQIAPERSSVRQWLTTAEWPTVVAWVGVQLARALDEAHRLSNLYAVAFFKRVLEGDKEVPAKNAITPPMTAILSPTRRA